MKTAYDFVICGAGSSGSMVARRLSENAKGTAGAGAPLYEASMASNVSARLSKFAPGGGV